MTDGIYFARSKFWKSLVHKKSFDLIWLVVFKLEHFTAQKMKVSTKDFFSKCDHIRSFLRIWSHLLKKSLMENFIFLCSGCQWRRSGVFIVNFEHVSHLVLVFPSLTLSKRNAGWVAVNYFSKTISIIILERSQNMRLITI